MVCNHGVASSILARSTNLFTVLDELLVPYVNLVRDLRQFALRSAGEARVPAFLLVFSAEA